jgi:2-oxoglutarate ferredoxin oxidoreductase subunit beta
LALGAEATFVARSVDVFQPHLKEVLRKAAAHKGSAFIEILQNCNIFNDGAWESLTEKDVRDDHTIALEHGKPLVFGRNKAKGIRMRGLDLEVVSLGNGVTESDLVVHDEKNPSPAYAFLLSRMDQTPDLPTPIGVLRAVDAPRYEVGMADQIRTVTGTKGKADLAELLRAGDTWEVK